MTHGIDVTLFATLDSVTTATLDGVCPHGYADDPSMDGRVWEALHVAHALGRSAEFDLVHSHLDRLPLAFASNCRAPLLTTIHGSSGPAILPAYARARSAYVSISDSDRGVGRCGGTGRCRTHWSRRQVTTRAGGWPVTCALGEWVFHLWLALALCECQPNGMRPRVGGTVCSGHRRSVRAVPSWARRC